MSNAAVDTVHWTDRTADRQKAYLAGTESATVSGWLVEKVDALLIGR